MTDNDNDRWTKPIANPACTYAVQDNYRIIRTCLDSEGHGEPAEWWLAWRTRGTTIATPADSAPVVILCVDPLHETMGFPSMQCQLLQCLPYLVCGLVHKLCVLTVLYFQWASERLHSATVYSFLGISPILWTAYAIDDVTVTPHCACASGVKQLVLSTCHCLS
jgi:hypothetical protein